MSRSRLLASRFGGTFAAAILLGSSAANAQSVYEYPSLGPESLGRGGAWVARASDPTALVHNPAGLARQASRLAVGEDLPIRTPCFGRVKALADDTDDGMSPGQAYPEVCGRSALVPVGFLATTLRISDRVGLGFGIVAPPGVAAVTWPRFFNGGPAPQRHLALSSTTAMAVPTVGVGVRVVEGLRAGAQVGWGIAYARGTVAAPGLGKGGLRPQDDDVAVTVSGVDLSSPRAGLGVLATPSPWVDLGAQVSWTAPIAARGDVQTEAGAFSDAAARGDTSKVARGDTSVSDCGQPPGSACGSGNNALLRVAMPPSAKLGVRFRVPRSRVRTGTLEPLDDEWFDVEIDATYTAHSAVDGIRVELPANGDVGALPVAGTAGTLPPRVHAARRYRDTVTLHAGTDVNVVPGKLALRAGSFFEPRSADPTAFGLEAMAGQRLGVSLGATVRIAQKNGSAFDISAAAMRMWVADIAQRDPGGVALPATTGAPPHRTAYPVGLGTLTDGLWVVNLSVAYRFK